MRPFFLGLIMCDLLPIGTPVIFTNDYGVVFDRDYVISGYLEEGHDLYKWGYRYYTNCSEAPWMPKKPSHLNIRNPGPSPKKTIKEAALMMLADEVVMRRGELVAALESHMTATEKGKHFFDVREAINELVACGLVTRQVVTDGLREQQILIGTGIYTLP